MHINEISKTAMYHSTRVIIVFRPKTIPTGVSHSALYFWDREGEGRVGGCGGLKTKQIWLCSFPTLFFCIISAQTKPPCCNLSLSFQGRHVFRTAGNTTQKRKNQAALCWLAPISITETFANRGHLHRNTKHTNHETNLVFTAEITPIMQS